ncbi:MAG: TetR family transcriptional regulator [Actinobacteria bacterium]|nr:TetR family transcriptional regulator [Actinomycetota bacterium]
MGESEARPGLRERKKQRTHDDLQRIAIRLFLERGYDHVTVEEIAAEADVSNRTFYRYFTSKEDLVLGGVDDMAEALREALDARPVDEPVLASLAVVTVDLATLFIGDPDEVVARSRIIEANPILQQRNLERRPHLEESLLPFVADRLGLDPDDDPLPRLLVACVAAVSRTVIDRWIQRGSTEPLAPAVDEAFHLLEAGFGERLARVEVGAPR